MLIDIFISDLFSWMYCFLSSFARTICNQKQPEQQQQMFQASRSTALRRVPTAATALVKWRQQFSAHRILLSQGSALQQYYPCLFLALVERFFLCLIQCRGAI